MRHHKAHRKLGRTSAHRQATLRSLATSLFRHGRIHTTLAKAKELRSFSEKLITLAKKGDLAARRRAAQDLRDSEILQKLFVELGPKFATRPGGYTRVLKTGFRRGDNAPTALIELVDGEVAASASSATDDAESSAA